MSPRRADDTVLRASRVSRSFSGAFAVRDVDLVLEPGEIHALVGLNGAGKTTLMRLMLGMLRPDSGQVTVRTAEATTPVDVREAPSSTWREVGHLIETPFSYAELTVAETIRCAARLRGLSRAAAGPAAQRVVEELALGQWAHRRTRTLSLGNRQRVGLACALVHRPRLLVLDEPSNALDPAGVLVVRRALKAASAAGSAVLVSSHHLDEVARTAHRITVMHRGEVVGALPPQGADLERQLFAMIAAYDGVEADVLDTPSEARTAGGRA